MRDAVFAEFEIFFLEAVEDFAGFGFDCGVEHDEVDIDVNNAGGLFGGVLSLRGGGREKYQDETKIEEWYSVIRSRRDIAYSL